MNGNDFKEGDATEVVLEGLQTHKQPSHDGGAGRDGVPPKYGYRYTGLISE
jgi:hypothetical protein